MIDAHQHYWEADRHFQAETGTWFLGVVGYPWAETGLVDLARSFMPVDLEPLLEAAALTKTVLINVLNNRQETEWMLEVAAQTESIVGVVGWIDLTRPKELVEQEVLELKSHPKFVGVRHLTQFDPDKDWLLRDETIRGLEVLARSKLPFDLLVTSRELPHLPELSERVPDLQMVIDHGGKPAIATGEINRWEELVREAAHNPAISCKLSGLVTEADHLDWKPEDLLPYVEVLLENFGGERLIFGSDWPVCTLAASYNTVIETARWSLAAANGTEHLDPALAKQVFCSNAARLYRLPYPRPPDASSSG